MPIDTKYFSQEFKEKLLEKLTEKVDLDDLLDSILVKSENWQALNLLLEQYKNKIQCIYIDPPYNTGNDTFLYKDKYKDSRWLSMIIERLSLFHNLGTEDAVFFISIDDHELPRLTAITEAEFGKDSLLGPIIVQVNKGGRSYLPIAKTHEYIVCGTVNRNESAIRELPKENEEEFRYKDSRGIYTLRELRNRNPKFTRKNRPNLFYPFYIDPQNTDKYGSCVVSLTKTMKHTIEVVPKNKKGEDVGMANYFDTVIIPRLKKVCYSFNWKDGIPQDTDGISQFFKYHILEQYEDTLDNIELTPSKQAELKFGDDYLLKYFLDYETRGNPSLLNIERLKNPFSYRLKVNLEEVGEPQEMMVDIPETFNYLLGLKVKKIKAREIASPLAGNEKERKYLFILGEKKGQDIAIVWREYNDDWSEDDFKEDKKFIIKELEPWAPHIVYVNGQSVLIPKLDKHTVEVRYIEPEFKRLMEA